MRRTTMMFSATTKQQTTFGAELLLPAVEWITDTFEPDDIYDDKYIGEWVRTYAARCCNPADVFDEDELETWAKENGYAKAPEDGE